MFANPPSSVALHLGVRSVSHTCYRDHESAVQSAIHDAARAARNDKRETWHTLRRGCATYRLEAGADIRSIQSWRDDKDVRTTMISTHIVDGRPLCVVSPLDR